jgi:hypothetical protein
MRKNNITGVSYCNHILSGRLDKLEEFDYGGGVRVEVADAKAPVSVSH